LLSVLVAMIATFFCAILNCTSTIASMSRPRSRLSSSGIPKMRRPHYSPSLES
jgi:hypothetical protein